MRKIPHHIRRCFVETAANADYTYGIYTHAYVARRGILSLYENTNPTCVYNYCIIDNLLLYII